MKMQRTKNGQELEEQEQVKRFVLPDIKLVINLQSQIC